MKKRASDWLAVQIEVVMVAWIWFGWRGLVFLVRDWFSPFKLEESYGKSK